MSLLTIAQKGGFHLSAKPAEAMGGEYIPMILNLQWIIVFEETSEISSEISAEFGFFPVSTKMKAHWACASIFRRLKSYVISFLYLFASFVMAILLLREDPSQIWNRWKHLSSGHPDGFQETSLVSACRLITIYRDTYRGSIVSSLCERRTNLCKNPWRVCRLLIIFSASGFPVIIKFQPAPCTLHPAKYTCRFLWAIAPTRS